MEEKKHLYILWTNADIDTAEKMVFMYGVNSLRRGWWERVTFIVWGATAKLAAENPMIRKLIAEALEEGAEVSACRACADMYGVIDELEAQGIGVIYWGDPLTRILKADEKLLTV